MPAATTTSQEIMQPDTSLSPIKREIAVNNNSYNIAAGSEEEVKKDDIAVKIDIEVNVPKVEPTRILKIKKAIIIPKSTEAAELKLHPVINQLKLRTNQGLLENNTASKNLKIANKSSEMSLA